MRDFTVAKYEALLKAAIDTGYTLTSYEDYISSKEENKKQFILRHDVDDLPENSLRTAQLEHSLGAKGTYYFRVVKQSLKPEVIQKIAALGHEIGYHYEDMALCGGKQEKAFAHFKKYLAVFRQFYPVSTICMHGSPLSKWDNRLLWKHYNYKELGILAEPYFDTDFNKVLYITDTGRQWNNATSSVRDKVDSSFQFDFRSTDNIIKAFKQDKLPNHIMLNIHPQRWTNNLFVWWKELLLQNLKNGIKRFLVKG